jgi:sugar lactone lactonase YvrE
VRLLRFARNDKKPGGTMKKFFITTLLIVFVFSILSAQPYQIRQIWTSKKTLKVPESVIYDAERKIFYIANINGTPLEKNNRGFISKMKMGGKIDKMKWITDLNAPKGMGIYKAKLFVSDIDRLAEITITTGKIDKYHEVAGAKFLNDVTVTPDRTVYVSDSDEKNSVIYRLKDGKIEEWLRDEQIAKPNGLYAEKERLIVGSFGNNTLFAVSFADKKIEKIADVGMGIDGVVPDGKGNYFVSDWQGRIALVTAAGEVTILSDTREERVNAADIEYLIDVQVLLVPTFFDHKVVAYKVE